MSSRATTTTASKLEFTHQSFLFQGVHVSPDCFDNSWDGVPFSTLISWALAPASDEALFALHDKGRADAAAWARLTGVGHAASLDQDDLLR